MKMLAILLFTAFLLLSLSKYFFGFNITSRFYTVLWFIADTTFYAKLTSLSLLLFWTRLSFYSFTDTLSSTVRGESLRSTTPTMNKWLLGGSSKSLTKPLLYRSMLTNPTIRLGMFSNESSQGTSTEAFYTRMYTVLAPITLNNHFAWSIGVTNPATNSPTAPLVTLCDYSTPTQNTTPLTSLWAFTTTNDWDLPSDNNESLKDKLVTYPRGVFNVNLTNFTDLPLATLQTRNTLSLLPLLNKQLDWVRTSRWMYRYNLLHRRTIASSHKNTLTKRLLTSGFYDNSFDKLNINATSIKTLNPEWANLVNYMMSTSYKGFYSLDTNMFARFTASSEVSNTEALSNLSWSEDSYFWAVKRFSLFSTLPTLTREYGPALSHTVTSQPIKPHPSSSPSPLAVNLKSTLLNFPRAEVSAQSNNLKNPYSLTSSLTSYDTSMTDLFSYDFSEQSLLLLKKPAVENPKNFYYSSVTPTRITPNF